jgi:hypothetical protein
MTKKVLPVLLIAAICTITFFSCKKSNNNTIDPTLNYFPLTFGKWVSYNVDSTYYFGPQSGGNACTQLKISCQMKYSIDDTFTNSAGYTSYIMDVFTRPYNGGLWQQTNVIIITPTPTPLATTSSEKTTSLLYTQDQTQYVKLIFPITSGYSWTGNQYANITDTTFAYLANWDYTYQNVNAFYNNDFINFEHTVTVLEADETVNDNNYDSSVYYGGYRTYAKEIYGYNVGMIYKEWTHYTWTATDPNCWNGYSVVMRAIDHN